MEKAVLSFFRFDIVVSEMLDVISNIAFPALLGTDGIQAVARDPGCEAEAIKHTDVLIELLL